MNFKAAVLRRLNEPLSIETLQVPPLGVGQVLVKVRCSGVCGAQLGEIAGVKGNDRFLPHLMGHEGAGTVVDVGLGVRHVAVNDSVIMHWRKGVGIEANPPKYKIANDRGYELVGGGWITTFNEMAVVSENRLTKVPGTTSPEFMALMGCALTTALGVVNNDARLKFGQSIAVIGCGGVGLNVIQAAAMASGCPIIGVDIVEEKLHMAKRFGADAVSTQSDIIMTMTGNKGADVVVETTGKVALIEMAYRMTAPTGKTILVGQMRHDHCASIQTLPMHAGKTLMASEGGQTDPTVDIPRYLGLYNKGVLKLEGLVTHRYPLDRINEALDEIRAGRVGRCIIDMEKPCN